MSCSVCCDAYTPKIRTKVCCPGCSYEACVRCVKRFLLTTFSDPNCMNCGLYWNRSFIDEITSASWRNGELRRHRERTLFDRERSLLPATQPAVQLAVVRARRAAHRRELTQELRTLRARMKEIKHELYRTEREAYRGEAADDEPEEERRRSFVAACPRETCRGFLSSQYKCGTCLGSFCPSCREPKTPHHVCDAGVVESLRVIARESRACPGCGMAISRVSGCDQMYCTMCDMAFSYATGQRITGVIHNPHYFERLRQLRERASQEAPDAGEEACREGWPQWSHFAWLRRGTWDNRLLSSMYRTATNIERTVLPLMPTDRRPADNEDLRVRYCMETLEDARFMQLLQQREKKREFALEVRQTLELFVIQCMELCLRSLDMRGNEPGLRALLELHVKQVSELVNEPLKTVARRFGRSVPQIKLTISESYDDLLCQGAYAAKDKKILGQAHET